MLDILLFLVFLFVIAIAAVVGNLVVNSLNDDIQADDTFSNTTRENAEEFTKNYPTLWDNAFAFAVILLWALLLITSFFIDTHPAFFIIMVVLLISTFIIGMLLSNSYTELMADGELSVFEAEFPRTSFIMSNLLIITIVIAGTTLLALYAKRRI